MPRPTPTLGRGRVLGALLVMGPVVVLVFLPTVLGLDRHVVTDRAMEGDVAGSISRGSVAFTRSMPAADLAIGDVIVFRPPVQDGTTPDSSVTRRIVAIEDGLASTQGDNQDAQDPWQLDGSSGTYSRVVFAVPWIGHPFSGWAGEGGWLLLVATIGVALVLAVLTSWRGARQRRRPARAAPFRPAARHQMSRGPGSRGGR